MPVAQTNASLTSITFEQNERTAHEIDNLPGWLGSGYFYHPVCSWLGVTAGHGPYRSPEESFGQKQSRRRTAPMAKMDRNS